MKLLIVPAILLALASPARADEWRLRLDGVGPLKIGMSFDAASKLVGNLLLRTKVDERASPDCDYLALPGHDGIYVMFVNDKLKRVDIQQRAFTDKGDTIGDPVAGLINRYPGIKIEPADYTPADSYLTYRPNNGALAMRFLEHDGKIEAILAGAIKQVQVMEGCL